MHEGASQQREKNQGPDKGNSRWHEEVPAAVDMAWPVTPPCQNLVCGIRLLDGTDTLKDVPRLGNT